MKHSVVLKVGQSRWVCKDCPFTSRSDYDASKHAQENSGVEKSSPNAYAEPKQTYCRWCGLAITICSLQSLTSYKNSDCKGWIHDGGAHSCLPRVAELDVEPKKVINPFNRELLDNFGEALLTWNEKYDEASKIELDRLGRLILGKMWGRDKPFSFKLVSNTFI